MIEMMTLDAQRILTVGTQAERENLMSYFGDESRNITVNYNMSNADFM